MTDALYLSPPLPVRDARKQAGRARKKELERVQDIISEALSADPNAILEAKSWLHTTLAGLPAVSARTCLAAFLPGPSPCRPQTPTGLHLAPQRQLLQLLAEHAAPQVSAMLSASSQLLRDFFGGSDRHLRMWFGHFHMAGITRFKFGATALANFCLANRQTAWCHLVWLGRHAQAPVAVANKTHYFCELDVVATMHNMLDACPEFWRSEQLLRSLASGEWLALDYPFCVLELERVLVQGSGPERAQLWQLLQSFVEGGAAGQGGAGGWDAGGAANEGIGGSSSGRDAGGSWRLLCEGVLPLMVEAELLAVVDVLRDRHFCRGGDGGDMRNWAVRTAVAAAQPPAAAGPGLAATSLGWCTDVAPLVLAGTRWGGLRQLLLANALSCARAQLLQVLRQDEEAVGKLRELVDISADLHSGVGTSGRSGSFLDAYRQGASTGAPAGCSHGGSIPAGGGGAGAGGGGRAAGGSAAGGSAAGGGSSPADSSGAGHASLLARYCAGGLLDSPQGRLLLLLEFWTLRLQLLQQAAAGEGALQPLLAQLQSALCGNAVRAAGGAAEGCADRATPLARKRAAGGAEVAAAPAGALAVAPAAARDPALLLVAAGSARAEPAVPAGGAGGAAAPGGAAAAGGAAGADGAAGPALPVSPHAPAGASCDTSAPQQQQQQRQGAAAREVLRRGLSQVHRRSRERHRSKEGRRKKRSGRRERRREGRRSKRRRRTSASSSCTSSSDGPRSQESSSSGSSGGELLDPSDAPALLRVSERLFRPGREGGAGGGRRAGGSTLPGGSSGQGAAGSADLAAHCPASPGEIPGPGAYMGALSAGVAAGGGRPVDGGAAVLADALACCAAACWVAALDRSM